MTVKRRGFMKVRKIIYVNTFTDGLVGPSLPMIGPVADGLSGGT